MKTSKSRMNTNQLREYAVSLGADRKRLYGTSRQAMLLIISDLEKQQKATAEHRKGADSMKVTIKVNGKKISQKKAKELYGEERMKARIAEAKQAYAEDPMELNTWMDGMEIIISR
jgi:L-cysteine desulfidase